MGILSLPTFFVPTFSGGFKRVVSSHEFAGVEDGIVAPVAPGCMRLTNSSINVVFRSVASEILTKDCKMRFLDYESLGFGECGECSAPLIDVDQLMAPHPSLC